jgi:cytochrome c-type biogenesis protein
VTLLLVSFLAGVLTVAAPCVLPLLPVIIGSAALGPAGRKSWRRPLIICASLATSVVIFTILLKASTALISIPQTVWSFLSGGIVVLFGLTLLLPALWAKIMASTRLQTKSDQLLQSAGTHHGTTRDVLIGAALGPVFSSCSPTYALIVAAILPESFTRGLLYLTAYTLGLTLTLLITALAGRTAVHRLGWLANPGGWFKRTIGLLFIITGLAVLFGLDKLAQAYILEQGWYDPVMRLEQIIPH